jgi:hypothetical protein
MKGSSATINSPDDSFFPLPPSRNIYMSGGVRRFAI